ncbi:hypothetical protein OROMI_013615 [Orobanche minor]
MFRSTIIRRRLLASLMFSKSPAFSSINVAAVADFPPNDVVSQIIGHFNSSPLGYSQKLLLNSLRNSNWFRNEVPELEPSEIETIIEKISSQLSSSSCCKMNLVSSTRRIRSSSPRGGEDAIPCAAVSSADCDSGTSGTGSAPSFCELLSKSFRGWESSHLVWDMLAFVYSGTAVVYDALVVLSKMKDFNIRPSVMTYNSLLHNLRETDIAWDIYILNSKITAFLDS